MLITRLLLLFGLTALVIIVLIIIIKSRKKKKPLKQGDYVMLRVKYKHQYPGVPTTHAMVIESIAEQEAVVVFLNLNRQILKEKIPLYALALAV